MTSYARAFRTLIKFARTPTLSRTIVGLLGAAILLLLLVNLATLVMIRRTADFNESVEHTQEVRLIAHQVMTQMVNAETAQRGYILTGRPEYLERFEAAADRLPEVVDRLAFLTSDHPEQMARVERFRAVGEERFGYMRDSIDFARQGRVGEAVQVVRSGSGSTLMLAHRELAAEIDAAEVELLIRRRAQSERAATATAAVNAIAGLLIIVMALVCLWLVRRYVAEIERARAALDLMNLELEDKVRDRTAALTRANEEIQRFAYIVSHDLRAPLVNVMGYTAELEQAGKVLDHQIARLETASSDLIEHEAVSAVREDVPEAIGFIRASTQKMDRLINAILRLSREGRRILTPEPLNMMAMVRQIADSVRHQIEDAHAEIVVGDLPQLESDRLSIEQVFGNLIDNAVKYLDPDRPGRIEVTGRDLGAEGLEYRVSDNGRGVADRDFERIFELFRRAGRQDQTGEGLGLAFVRASVRRLNGTINIQSDLGRGSTFILKFPKRLIVEPGDRL